MDLDAIEILNDIFEENGVPRLKKKTIYYADDWEDEGFTPVERLEIPFPMYQAVLNKLETNTLDFWTTLEEVPKAILAYNPDNHHLFNHLSDEEIEGLLSEYYQAYLENRYDDDEDDVDEDIDD